MAAYNMHNCYSHYQRYGDKQYVASTRPVGETDQRPTVTLIKVFSIMV